jgi:hypothetical protein
MLDFPLDINTFVTYKALYLNTMKKLTLILTLTIAAFTFKAQQSGTWQNAILRADGLNQIDGVEAYCMKTTCNDEDFVLIKFVNKNSYKVRVEWKDAIFVNGTWYYSNNPNKVLVLAPNNETIGQCEGTDKLKVNISSIIENPKNFGHYTVSGLAINK